MVKLLSLREVAEAVGVSESALRRQCASRKLAYFRVCGKLKFKEADVERWLEGERQVAKELDLRERRRSALELAKERREVAP